MADEKKTDSGKEQKSGLPKLSAIHVVIAIAVVIIAVIFVAKFGFGTDLLSTSSGEMAIVKRPVVTPVPTLIQKDIVRPTLSLRPEPVPTCAASTTQCGDTCTDTATDPNNCGYCGRVCSVSYADAKNVAEYGCAAGQCTIKSCQAGYGDCRNQGPLTVNGGACETKLSTGFVWNDGTQKYISDPVPGSQKLYLRDTTDCGSCGNSCVEHIPNVISFCDNGACRKVCQGMWLDCNNNMADNCETGWDKDNCGACGAKCPSGTNCYTGCCRTPEYLSHGEVVTPECQTDSLGGKNRHYWAG
jgi:hypothetical protein